MAETVDVAMDPGQDDVVTGLTVQRLGEEDWPRVRAVRLASLGQAPEAFCSTLEGERGLPEEEWRRRAGRPDGTTLVLVDADGRDVGTATVIPHGEEPHDAVVVGVWVDPSVRGTGAARALMTAAMQDARDRGFPRLRLEVADDNAAAIAFYERLGFIPTGRRTPMPPPNAHRTEHELALDL